jgi:hypothetical protein
MRYFANHHLKVLYLQNILAMYPMVSHPMATYSRHKTPKTVKRKIANKMTLYFANKLMVISVIGYFAYWFLINVL